MKQLRTLRSALIVLLGIIACLSAEQGLHAQETVPASGGEATGSGGFVSYTVGQVAYTTNSSVDGSVAQGVQQPYEISISVGIEVTEIDLTLIAYPNPTNDHLTLTVGNYNSENLTYQLYTTQGELVEAKRIDGSNTSINMLELSSSIYLLKVLENGTLVKTFRIVKN